MLLIGSLIAHLAKEMQESKVGEEHAHKEYTFISEPAASRAGKVNELDVLQDTMASVSMSLTHSKEEAASAVTRLVVLAVRAIFWGPCVRHREGDVAESPGVRPPGDSPLVSGPGLLHGRFFEASKTRTSRRCIRGQQVLAAVSSTTIRSKVNTHTIELNRLKEWTDKLEPSELARCNGMNHAKQEDH